MKTYILTIIIFSMLLCGLILMQDRSVIVVSNIRHLKGSIAISSSAISSFRNERKTIDKWKIKDLIEIEISQQIIYK